MPHLPSDPLARLPRYPFERLHRLLDGVAPPSGIAPIIMSLGEPRRPPPAVIAETLTREAAGWGRYPPLSGTPSFRLAVARWLTRRYGLPEGFIDPQTMILPATGSREAIYLSAGALLPESSIRPDERPVVLVPEPGYHVYGGAGAMAGAEVISLPARRETGFLPDIAGTDPAILKRTRIVYICSPANPQGSAADLSYLRNLLELALIHDFVVAADECYSEIYDRVPPVGLLEAAASMGSRANAARDHCVVFNSLSKRSSAPGLRSGFVAGGPAPMKRIARLRDFSAPTLPYPMLAASEALWNDDAHVEEARAHYRRNFDVAEQVLGGRFGFQRPAGGFFLWLDVGDGEAAALKLWRDTALRTLPGAYLCPRDQGFRAHASPFIRLALVHESGEVAEAMRRVRDTLADSPTAANVYSPAPPP
ncbi:MAG TPA: aminotransferase class I/II-fold pyridoxal phosphate-dependent enzyme [Alphaproteobacteria bacterium]|nr:aminotransferase class I/II-fold pyridoxal phosphate-dependent enzyme [Alphaproteobacteria bacterium]